MLQDHRYLDPPILGVLAFAHQESTSRLPEPTPLTVYRAVPQVPPPLCSSMCYYVITQMLTVSPYKVRDSCVTTLSPHNTQCCHDPGSSALGAPDPRRTETFPRQASTSRLPEPTPLTVYRDVSQVPPPLCGKDYYQAFFWVLIDLIVELLVLIIKPFDNQTES